MYKRPGSESISLVIKLILQKGLWLLYINKPIYLDLSFIHIQLARLIMNSNKPCIYRSASDSSFLDHGILINSSRKELRRRVTFSRVVILNDPKTFILVKEERGLVRRLSDRSLE
jgi:hypothetical protein